MTQQRTNTPTQEDENLAHGSTHDARLKRRGILAAAGAAVAGMVAKRASEPVSAGLGNGTAITVGDDSRGSSRTYLYAFEANPAVTFVSDVVWEADASTLPNTIAGGTTPYNVSGIRATGKGTGDGIIGYSGAGNGYGVYGQSAVGTGTYGQSSGNTFSKGVHGHHTGNGYGVYGDAGTDGYGATGVATTGRGVSGSATSGYGVYGKSTGTNAAVYGENLSGIGVHGYTQTTGVGVKGENANGYGVYGVCSTSGFGVYGVSGTNYGVRGDSGGSVAAVYGQNLSGDNAIGVHGNTQTTGIGVKGSNTNGYGVYGFCTGSGFGVYGVAQNTGVRGEIPAGSVANTKAVYGNNQSTGAGSIGVQGIAASGLGASFQGGIAPVRLIPGTLPARNLAAAGHQAGELYVTSDARLFFFDGTNWREVMLAAPGSGVPPAAVTRPSTQGDPPGPVQPAPSPRSG